MISDAKQTQAAQAQSEPSSGKDPVPVWLFILLFLLLYWGMVYFDQRGGWFDPRVYAPFHTFAQVETWQPVSGAAGLFQQGKAVYNKPTCAACHQADGNGVANQFPSLVGSEWVNEPEPGRVIRIALNGLTGTITVKNQTLSGTMVPWKDTLSDEEIAAVLTYIRQNKEWGNHAPEVTPERVKAVRKKIEGRSTPFTPDELKQIPASD